MVARSQRRVFKSRFRSIVFPHQHGPGLRLSIGKRRGAATPLDITTTLDAPDDNAAEKAPGLRPRVARIPAPGEQEGSGLHAELRGRDRALHLQPREIVPTRLARSEPVRRDDADGLAIPGA